MSLRVGYAQETITPSLDRGVYLAGFGRDRRAASVHDDLYARALALAAGETTVVLVALDLIGLERPECQEVARQVEAQAPGVGVIVASTHTHHGPDTLGLWGPNDGTSGVDRGYLRRAKELAAKSALAAISGLAPATLRVAAIRVRGVAKNARDPEIVDDEATCLQFVSPGSGAARATLVDFPCHPEVLWRDNPGISSDYPAFVRREVEEATSAPCVFLAGALGGMMTPDVRDHSFEEAEAMGKAIAGAGLSALARAPAVEVTGLDYARVEFQVPLENPLFLAAVAAGLLPRRAGPDQLLTTETSLLRIGPASLAMVPGELLPKLGLALKAGLLQAEGEVAAIVGLANDEIGYILPAEDFAYPTDPFSPGENYEETMSLGKDVGPRLMHAARTLLQQRSG